MIVWANEERCIRQRPAFLNWLVRLDQLAANPLAKIDKVDARGKQVRDPCAFTEDELQRLFAVAGRRLPACLVLLYTGRHGINQRAAQDVLGHSDPSLTARAYTDVAALALHSEIAITVDFEGGKTLTMARPKIRKSGSFGVTPCR